MKLSWHGSIGSPALWREGLKLRAGMYSTILNKRINDHIFFLTEEIDDAFNGETPYDKILNIAKYLKINGILPINFDFRKDVKGENLTRTFFFACKEPDPSSTAMFLIRVKEDGGVEIINKKTKDIHEVIEDNYSKAVADFILLKNKSNALPAELPGSTQTALPGMNGEGGVEPNQLAGVPTA